MRNYRYSKNIFIAKNIFLILSFVLLIISVLRPAWGTKEKTIEAKGTDIIFTLDVSKSMKALDLNEDGNNIDRLEMSKGMIADFVSEHPQNRYGLVIFAGEAFVSTPLTLDQSAFLTFLNGVDYNDVGTQGTNINEALKSSIDRFYNNQDKDRGRSIVLISDGEEEMTDNIENLAKVAKDAHINIFTVGVGSTEGTEIPEGRDFFGRIIYKQYKGQNVITKLNEDVLKKIASQTGGKYFHAEKKSDLNEINKELQNLETTTIKSSEKSGKEDRFQLFLLPALLFFLLYLFIEPGQNFGKYFKFSLFILMVLPLSGCTENKLSFRYHLSRGNEGYKKEYYKDAQTEYKKAGDSSRQLKYISENNSGITDYSIENYEAAVKTIKQAVTDYCDRDRKEYCDQLYYNLGNSYYRLGEKNIEQQDKSWQEAIDAYKKVMIIDPKNKDAQDNIDFILKKKEKQKQEEQQKNNSNKENQKDGQNKQSDGSGNNKNSKEDSKKSNDNTKGGDASKQENTKSTDDKKNAQGGESQNTKDSKNGNTGSSSALDEKTNAQVDSYLKELENQEKNNQGYFKQNPKSNSNPDQFGGMFDSQFMNDPFFKDFFNNTQNDNELNKNEKSNNGIDW